LLSSALVCLVLAGCGATIHPLAVSDPQPPLLIWTNPAAISYGSALSAMQLDATASVPGTFTYDPALGTILNAGSNTLSTTFTPADIADYSIAKTSVLVVVNQVSPVTTWIAPAAISYGSVLSGTQLDAAASVPGTFAYEPALGALLNAGPQALSVTFTPTDTVDYLTATATVPITVQQAAPVLAWAAPAAISYGTFLSATQLRATASVPGTFAYEPAPGTLLSVGMQTLSVTFTPTDDVDYTTASATVNLSVSKATPLITWAPNDPIVLGVPLGASQLDATASAPGNSMPVAGSFLYTPAAGTTFSATGQQRLSLTFTPTDLQDYIPVEANINMTASSFGIAAWGDSATSGRDGAIDEGVYPTDLQQLIALPVVNLGVQDQTTTQIGVREGAVATTVSVAGGVIPSSGGVQVTFPAAYQPLNITGPTGGVAGTILGVHGVVTIPAGVCTFTRTSPGSSVSAPGTPTLVVDTPYASYLPIFWEGRNNKLSAAQQVMSDIAAQVATVPAGQTYLVMSLINFNVQPEWAGRPDYKAILALNNQLANTYGSHYLDIREVLVSHYNPALITDVSDYQHDEVPTSLRAIFRNATLTNAIGPTDTSLVLNVTFGSSSFNHILTVDTGANAENVQITAVDGNTVTVVRNFGGLNTSHVAGAPVVETDEIHPNGQGYQVVADAVAQFLSAYEVQAQQTAAGSAHGQQ
jgi:hypothetical protein